MTGRGSEPKVLDGSPRPVPVPASEDAPVRLYSSGTVYYATDQRNPWPPLSSNADWTLLVNGTEFTHQVWLLSVGQATVEVDDAPSLSADTGSNLGLAYALDPLVATVTSQAASGAALGGTVRWPDGATGTFAIVRNGDDSVASYVVTHVLSGTTTTYTQPTITRDANGVQTNRPAITVS